MWRSSEIMESSGGCGCEEGYQGKIGQTGKMEI